MILLPEWIQNAEICIVADNAKTHQRKSAEDESPSHRRSGVKRTTSLPMDLAFSRRRRARRRGSDPNVPASSRWSAEPALALAKKSSQENVAVVPDDSCAHEKIKVDAPPTTACVLRNVVKPVRQTSSEDLFKKSPFVPAQ